MKKTKVQPTKRVKLTRKDWFDIWEKYEISLMNGVFPQDFKRLEELVNAAIRRKK